MFVALLTSSAFDRPLELVMETPLLCSWDRPVVSDVDVPVLAPLPRVWDAEVDGPSVPE